MKEDLVIRGGEQIRKPQNADAASVSTNGGSHPNSVNGQPVNNQGMGTSVQSNTYNPFNSEVTDEKYQKAFGKTSGLQATKKVRNAQTELFEKFNEVRTKLTRLSRDLSQPPKVRLSAQNCLAELETLQFRQLPEPAEKGNKQVRMMAFTDAVEDDYKKPNIKLMDDLINDYDLTTILSQMRRNTQAQMAHTSAVGGAIMANDDANYAMLAQQIEEGTAVVLNQIQDSEQNIKKQIVRTGNKIIGVVRDAQNKIINTVHLEGNMTREMVEYWGITNAQLTQFYGEANLKETHYHGVKNNKEIKHQGEQTRQTVEETSQQTQELNGISEKITVNMSNGAMFPHTQSTIDRVNNMRNKILQSNAPYERKKAALTHLAAFSSQTVMNDTELAQEEMKIQSMLNPSEARPRMDRTIVRGAEGTGGAVGEDGILEEGDPYYGERPGVPSPHIGPNTFPVPDEDSDIPPNVDEPNVKSKPKEDKPDTDEPAVPPSLQKPEDKKFPKPEWQK